ncbi:MAG: leucine-rich repeat domain-containing protein [Gammaproteobacteria bacterium]|nr:leucine-rich repeat domain-containing protein [Gammaproteobacteria bacterium]MCH9744069.1 leucine-rich repeat domain-containing protein [Gammaproteobacteria bacterium]
MPATGFKVHISGCLEAYSGQQSVVIVPANVVSLANHVFNGRVDITRVRLLEGAITMGGYAFSCCTELKSIDLPDSIAVIGDCVFYACQALVSARIPDGVTSTGIGVFYGCESLARVWLGTGMTAIADHMFFNCISLTSVTIPHCVTQIGADAFRGCTSLAGVRILGSMEKVGTQAFEGCTALTYIVDEGENKDLLVDLIDKGGLPDDIVILNANYDVIRTAGRTFEKDEQFDSLSELEKRLAVHRHFAPGTPLRPIIESYQQQHYEHHSVVDIKESKKKHRIRGGNITPEERTLLRVLMLIAYRIQRLNNPEDGAAVAAGILPALPNELWELIALMRVLKTPLCVTVAIPNNPKEPVVIKRRFFTTVSSYACIESGESESEAESVTSQNSHSC